MRAAVISEYRKHLSIENLSDPAVPRDGIVVRVRATGICRSDWHTWMGHDDAVSLPLVPGHEMAGEVVEAGPEVRRFRTGDRITVPFVLACGGCPVCLGGDHQVCADQVQPGVNFHGSFAEYVALPRADINVTHLPAGIGFAEAASLGCRFITAFRAVVEQGRTSPGEWVAVHGCGGVGLSAIMIAAASGASPVAVDISDEALSAAERLGAVRTINARAVDDVPGAIHDITGGGAHVSIDALGSTITCRNSILSLRRLGRHVQVGLMAEDHAEPPVPMGTVIGRELDIRGSHGMSPKNYPALFELIGQGKLAPAALIGDHISLSAGADLLVRMHAYPATGIAVIDDFEH
ncbi:MAG: zinc-dependent alcohol dehydrogenase family protein [Rhodospirillales bacterium]